MDPFVKLFFQQKVLKIDEETGTSKYPEMTFAIETVDNICAVYFALEYFMRLICSPKKLRFFFSGMNFIDFLAGGCS